MFIYNLKFNKKFILKIFICLSVIIIFSIIIFSIYINFFKNNSNSMNSNQILELNETNYTNILQSANEDIDSYIGIEVRVTGYIYRLLDFDENEFVIARDMKLENNSTSLIVGFLCNYKNAKDYADGTWVEVVGEIQKGNFNGDIAVLNVISIVETKKPDNLLVNPPDNTYIPTTNLFY